MFSIKRKRRKGRGATTNPRIAAKGGKEEDRNRLPRSQKKNPLPVGKKSSIVRFDKDAHASPPREREKGGSIQTPRASRPCNRSPEMKKEKGEGNREMGEKLPPKREGKGEKSSNSHFLHNS